MANHVSAKKRARQNLVRRARNKSFISNVRGTVRDFSTSLTDSTLDAAKLADTFKNVQSTLLRAVTKGLVHKNTASRKISRLSASMKKATEKK